MSRLQPKSYEQLVPEQQVLFDEIVANRPVKPVNDNIGGPFDIWLRSPTLGKHLMDLGTFFRFETSVNRRYIELAILVTGAYWQAQFEWFAHEPMARNAGVPDEVIAAIKVGNMPTFEDAGDRASYTLAQELHQTKQVSQTAFDQAQAQFGEAGVAELIGLCGFYGMVSMYLNGFDIELPQGAEYPFPK